jgi:hypothetical protein
MKGGLQGRNGGNRDSFAVAAPDNTVYPFTDGTREQDGARPGYARSPSLRLQRQRLHRGIRTGRHTLEASGLRARAFSMSGSEPTFTYVQGVMRFNSE